MLFTFDALTLLFLLFDRRHRGSIGPFATDAKNTFRIPGNSLWQDHWSLAISLYAICTLNAEGPHRRCYELVAAVGSDDHSGFQAAIGTRQEAVTEAFYTV